jgi:ATP-binding cassette subfamily B protein
MPPYGHGPLPLHRTFRQRLGALRNLKPFLRLVWKHQPGLAAASGVTRLVRALLPVAMLYVGKLILDQVAALLRLPGPLEPEALAGLWPLLGLELGLAIVSDLCGRAVGLFDALLSEQLTNVTSVELLNHAATLDLEDLEDSEQQDKLERARRQTQGRMVLMSLLLAQAQDVVTIATFAVGLFAYHPWMVALLVVAVLPAFLGEAHFNGEAYDLSFARTLERREIDYLRKAGTNVETAKEVKIFGLQPFLIDRYQSLSQSLFAANRKLAVRRAGWGALFSAVGTLGYYAAYAYIVWSTVYGRLSLGDLTFLAGSFLRLRGLLEGLLFGFTQLASQALYLEDLFSFFQTTSRIHSPPDAAPFPVPIREGITFDDVGFRYPGTERWAVRHLSFTLKAGEVLALVGENGAGKTTLVKLLARLYDPVEGRVLVDGRDLRDYALEEVRSNLGVIFQDFVRYHLSAGENIAVGRIDAREDQPRIEAAAERSLAAEVIRRFPLGYHQVLGKLLRQGTDLSGGEWQKIAIARAYMREAQLLILDEPTAALDARAEFEVFQRFKELSAGKTAVLISHRFSSVRMADRILVLNNGEVEAIGTHRELLEQRGRYAELFELQAAGYR